MRTSGKDEDRWTIQKVSILLNKWSFLRIFLKPIPLPKLMVINFLQSTIIIFIDQAWNMFNPQRKSKLADIYM